MSLKLMNYKIYPYLPTWRDNGQSDFVFKRYLLYLHLHEVTDNYLISFFSFTSRICPVLVARCRPHPPPDQNISPPWTASTRSATLAMRGTMTGDPRWASRHWLLIILKGSCTLCIFPLCVQWMVSERFLLYWRISFFLMFDKTEITFYLVPLVWLTP